MQHISTIDNAANKLQKKWKFVFAFYSRVQLIFLKCCLITNLPFCKFRSFFKYIQPNLYKMTALGTTQKWLSWAGGCLIKHLYKTTTNQMSSFLAGFYFIFSDGNISLNKDLQLRVFWCHSWRLKMFEIAFHVLRTKDGCFTVTLAPKLKMLLFYQSKF